MLPFRRKVVTQLYILPCLYLALTFTLYKNYILLSSTFICNYFLFTRNVSSIITFTEFF